MDACAAQTSLTVLSLMSTPDEHPSCSLFGVMLGSIRLDSRSLPISMKSATRLQQQLGDRVFNPKA